MTAPRQARHVSFNLPEDSQQAPRAGLHNSSNPSSQNSYIPAQPREIYPQQLIQSGFVGTPVTSDYYPPENQASVNAAFQNLNIHGNGTVPEPATMLIK